jgi:hypothetical protein
MTHTPPSLLTPAASPALDSSAQNQSSNPPHLISQVALVLVTVAATVLVVLQLALVVRRTTTRLVLAPTWNLPSPITPRPLLLSLRLNNNNHPQTPPKVVLAKVHVAAMVVLPQLVHSHVLTVERRQHHSGAATTSGTTFATLVVRRFTLFFQPAPLHKTSLSPHCCAGTFPWDGDFEVILSDYEIRVVSSALGLLFTPLCVVNDTADPLSPPVPYFPFPSLFLSENN